MQKIYADNEYLINWKPEGKQHGGIDDPEAVVFVWFHVKRLYRQFRN